jgi:adenine-specific DNA-methyltransferase
LVLTIFVILFLILLYPIFLFFSTPYIFCPVLRIELGEHCHTHIIPRLQKVINNQDPGGITKTVNWQGGGGFRYYKLAPSLLEKDKYDNWIISPKYNAAMLTEAMCKLMGFTYFPSQTHYWNQGYSSESDHIYVTTNHLNYDQLNAINQELREDQSLLICCKAYHVDPDQFPKITITKIPQAVLHQCEWGHDDYSLNVANLKTLEKPPQPIQIQQLSLLGDNEPKS